MLPDSAARFGDSKPFGLIFEPFDDQYFDFATLKFGYILGDFLKIVEKLFKPVFSIIFRALI